MANNFDYALRDLYDLLVAGSNRFDFVSSSTVDTTAPVTGSFTPAVSSTIAQADFLVFNTADNVALRRALILVSYPDSTYIVVHDGDAFAVGFAGVSTRTAISGGYQFSVRPNAGWTAAPTLRIIATDLSGNETA